MGHEANYKVDGAKTGIRLIENEYRRARDKFPPFNSAHEGLAVLWEEFEELKAEVFKKDASKMAMLSEAIQVGAMALAFIAECCEEPALED
ncbi:hypothetical protein LCGC14_0378610 [marine sediment metagenome]|uniref:Uncharacterized protein n=1 Tax=marine sediment metagenome TaxID=412755 RepID=A0A0F9WBQ6_9ZZZZ